MSWSVSGRGFGGAVSAHAQGAGKERQSWPAGGRLFWRVVSRSQLLCGRATGRAHRKSAPAPQEGRCTDWPFWSGLREAATSLQRAGLQSGLRGWLKNSPAESSDSLFARHIDLKGGWYRSLISQEGRPAMKRTQVHLYIHRFHESPRKLLVIAGAAFLFVSGCSKTDVEGTSSFIHVAQYVSHASIERPYLSGIERSENSNPSTGGQRGEQTVLGQRTLCLHAEWVRAYIHLLCPLGRSRPRPLLHAVFPEDAGGGRRAPPSVARTCLLLTPAQLCRDPVHG